MIAVNASSGRRSNFLESRFFAFLFLALSISIAPIAGADYALASLTPSTFITEINLSDKMSDGRQLLESLHAAAHSVNDYSCECTLVNFKGKKPTNTGARFFYKKPGQVRVEAVTRDYRNGSVVVRSNQKIRGVGGGLLKSLKMNLEEDSRMLRLPNGYCVVNTDFVSLFSDVKKSLDSGCLCRATKAPVTVPTADGKQNLYVFEVYKHSATGDEVVHRVLVDPKTMLPVEWGFFQDGKIVTTNLFKNMATNKGLSSELFTL